MALTDNLAGSTASGSFVGNYVAKTTAYTVLTTDYFISCSGTFTVTLPSAVAQGAGKVYVIKNVGSGTITIDASGSQTIDGGLTAELSVQYEAINITSNGTNWEIF